MIGWASRCCWQHPLEAQCRQVQPADEGIDHANRIILDHIIVEAIAKEDHLLAVFALHATLHSNPPIAGRSLSDQGVLTQPGPSAVWRMSRQNRSCPS